MNKFFPHQHFFDKFCLLVCTAGQFLEWTSFPCRPVHTNNFPCSNAGMTMQLLVKEKLVNLCCAHEQIKLVKGKLVKKNVVVCAGL